MVTIEFIADKIEPYKNMGIFKSGYRLDLPAEVMNLPSVILYGSY